MSYQEGSHVHSQPCFLVSNINNHTMHKLIQLMSVPMQVLTFQGDIVAYEHCHLIKTHHARVLCIDKASSSRMQTSKCLIFAMPTWSVGVKSAR